MDKIQNLVKKQKKYFETGKTKDLLFRINNLKKLKLGIKKHENRIIEALKEELNKSAFESYTSEIGLVYEEINQAIKHLKKWVKPKKVKTPITHFGSSSYIYYEPYGLTLIISPWNYPFQLAIAPLVGAISAGNCAIIKPSELTPKVSQIIRELIEESFHEEYIAVVEGGVDESTALLQEKFDYIFFTGSVPVGKIVMEAAAKFLTPITLELGGKSPSIVHKDANLQLAAKRIVWGKYLNAGQTCIAPDYLMVHKNVKNKLIEYMKDYIKEFYGTDSANSENYARIVNERHFNRLVSYLQDGRILIGGRTDKDKLFIEPTIIDQINWDSSIMKEEIFGPLLPVMEYEDVYEVIKIVNEHPKPLALYFFSKDKHLQNEIIDKISFGGGCINDTVYHFASPHLPFGGVGNSGMGSYHGKSSFELFSHKKSILKQTTLFDLPFRYPTTKDALKKVKLFLK
ncbi:aldehyde dehydrogenase [Vulcanibacillus modesticaldus]|uniref:Aldehyde dehydrogenase n=1 Tax=Vulcanibacillus modesticaldus TaxID=337097 RepID=A0A1D2YVZ3_9BACI|nr:aldehyde dehydrogenase [Vulcanibacillus modesticaldus]OEF99900.1 aldehyde dehydrogenase [Vulcanibacillus modesticaldus]